MAVLGLGLFGLGMKTGTWYEHRKTQAVELDYEKYKNYILRREARFSTEVSQLNKANEKKIQEIETAHQQEIEQTLATSQDLLNELSKRDDANDKACIANIEYLNALRRLLDTKP